MSDIEKKIVAKENGELEKKIIGFGHPLLDICCQVEYDFLHKYFIEPGSCNLAQKHQLPLYEELSQLRNVDFVPGGASMNTIRVARWMSQRDCCTFVGALGDDEFGCILERSLMKGGVKSLFQRVEDKPTGCCACLVVDKERSLLANIGAALEFKMDHLHSPAVEAAVSTAFLFYCEGFFLNTAASPQASIELGKHCAEHNKLFTYNLSAPYLCHIFKDRWAQVMPYIDIVFGSRIDIMAYAEAFQFIHQKDLKLVMGELANQPKFGRRPRIVVITGGSDATYVMTDKEFLEFTPRPIAPEKIIDTNGAGDSFVAGYISQLVLGRSITTCVEAGHLAAADVIQHSGCSFSEKPPVVPNLDGDQVLGTV